MDIFLFRQLLKDGVIDAPTFEKIESFEASRAVSVHKDLLALLYIGIFLLTTGLGIVIYQNLDTIGHVAITISIAVACATCFFYCFKKSTGYSYQKVESPNVWLDYILLLGCLLMLTLVGYLQFQFQVFGNRWGLATFVPMVILFFAAYYFDHLGVLSMAITNLGTWVGLTITPTHLLQGNNFDERRLIYSGVGLGLVLIAAGLASRFSNIKAHFYFTYKNFGAHLLFVSLLAGLFTYSHVHLWWFLAPTTFGDFSFCRSDKVSKARMRKGRRRPAVHGNEC